MVSEKTRQLANLIKDSIRKCGVNYSDLSDLLDVAIHAIDNENDIAWALKVTEYVKKCCEIGIRTERDILQLDALWWKVHKVEAPHIFESFLYYMEKNRRPDKRFYKPREKTLHIVVEDLQDLEDGKLDFLGISLPPRVGKSTLCIFFLAWIIGKRPASHNAMSGHSGILADRFYNDVIKFALNEEYTFSEIFPKVRLEKKSADKNELYFDKVEAFATLTCRGIDGTWTGAVDVSADGYLYVDDMVRDRTESLSAKRLNDKYQDYLNILVDRKNDGTRELMVGTRWNILDPLGRIEKSEGENPRYRFRKIPALDENNESNFVYDYGKGFSTEYFLSIKKRLDANEWMAKYQQRPFVREGLVFPEEELRTFNGILPEGDHRVFSACDIAWGGGDSLSMPIGYEYENGDVFVVDWIFNGGKKEVTIPLVIGKIMGEGIKQIQFEGNNGGDMYKKYVDEKLEEFRYRCSCTDKKAPARLEKMAKIIAYSGFVISKFVFLEEGKRSKEYQKAVEELTMFTADGGNTHDDAADGVTQLAMAIDGGNEICKAKVINSPV